MQSPLSYLNFEIDFTSDDVVSAYDELPLWSSMFGQLLLEHVPLERIGAALDVGCGTGFPLIELAERLGPDVEVHGVDPWGAALRRAAKKLNLQDLSSRASAGGWEGRGISGGSTFVIRDRAQGGGGGR
jgi:arsenite methyltransferase